MKPPPPMFPALGWGTASAKAVATAASTADPPFDSTAAPASHAGADVQTTSPFFEGTPSSGAASIAETAGKARVITARNTATRRGLVTFTMAAAYTRLRPHVTGAGYGEAGPRPPAWMRGSHYTAHGLAQPKLRIRN